MLRGTTRRWATLWVAALTSLTIALLSGSGCSVLNRFGPEVTCADLGGGDVNACSDGIIATCDGERVRYRVCEDDYEEISARDLCEAPWQIEGAYKCAPDGSGGSGGGGSGPPKIEIATVTVASDDNGDATLSPGESARIDIVAKNAGAFAVEGVTATLTTLAPSVSIASCTAYGNFGSSQACTSTCDCQNVSDNARQDFGPGETQSYAILAIEVRVADDAPLSPAQFALRFTDAAGASWNDSFELAVLDPLANIEVASASIQTDENADSALTPGETITLDIFAENLGASQALALSASLSGWDANVSLAGCTAYGDFGSSQACTSMCDCTNVSDNAKQDLGPAQSGSYPLLRIDLTLAESAPLTPVVFDLVFEDTWGNTWTDAVELAVVATGADIAIGSTDLSSESNGDGQLSPGETARLLIYAENTGSSQGLALSASLTGWSNHVSLSGCTAYGNFGSSQACTSGCDCKNVSDNAKQDLSPSQSGSYSLLAVDFTLDEAAPLTPITFDVELEDGWGNTWIDSYQLAVVATGADIEIATFSVVSDSGGDGQLSPGETATVRVFAENVGTSQVLDLAATATTSASGVSLTACTARGNFGSSQSCVPVCDCTNVSGNAKQDLSPSQTGAYGIVDIQLSLASGAPVSPITFSVVFEDAWNNTWNDSFQLPVVP